MGELRSTFAVSMRFTMPKSISSFALVSVFMGVLFSVLFVGSTHAQTVKSETFGSWSVSCGPQNCAMTQLVAKDEAAKQVMLGVSINYAFASELGALMVRLPANINKASGLGIKVDAHPAIQLPISQCNSAACQSIIKIDQKLLSEFSTGTVAKFAYATQGQQMILPISLSQFKQAYDSLSTEQLRRLQH
jgi:invasion protein IalB